MTADYLTEALRACRLPIRVAFYPADGHELADGEEWFAIEEDELWWNNFCYAEDAMRHYLKIRDRLLRQEDEEG